MKVILHTFDAGIQSLNSIDDGRSILQYKPAGYLRILRSKCVVSIRIWTRPCGSIPEFLDVLTVTAANVYQQDGVFRVAHTVYQLVLHRVEVRVHPTWSTLAIATHVVVELLTQGRVCIQIPEHVKLSVESILIRPIGYV